MEDAEELLLLQDEQMIEALTSHTAQKPLTDGIGSRGMIGGCEDLDVTRLGNTCEVHPKLAIIITDEVLRPHVIGGGDPSLLCGPSIGGRSCNADMNHFAGVQFDNEVGEERAEEEIGDREKAAGPDLLSMRV